MGEGRELWAGVCPQQSGSRWIRALLRQGAPIHLSQLQLRLGKPSLQSLLLPSPPPLLQTAWGEGGGWSDYRRQVVGRQLLSWINSKVELVLSPPSLPEPTMNVYWVGGVHLTHGAFYEVHELNQGAAYLSVTIIISLSLKAPLTLKILFTGILAKCFIRM